MNQHRQRTIAQPPPIFKPLCDRGLDPALVELVVSDGTTGLPKVLQQCLPEAQHQRCVTHKVRAMIRHLNYEHLMTHDENDQKLDKQEAKQQRKYQIQLKESIYFTIHIGLQ